jgi:hypothetical protein
VLSEKRDESLALRPAGYTFDRFDRCSFALSGIDETGVHDSFPKHYRAGPAIARSATKLGSGQTEIVSKDIDHQLVGRHVDLASPAITSEGNLHEE